MKLSGARIELPREEYDAFLYLRDHTYEDARAMVTRLERLVAQQEECAKTDKHLINEQSLTIEHLRKWSLAQHEHILKLQARLASLEPIKTAIEQPLFARTR
jgi:DNA-directed RNA polymerase subunit F